MVTVITLLLCHWATVSQCLESLLPSITPPLFWASWICLGDTWYLILLCLKNTRPWRTADLLWSRGMCFSWVGEPPVSGSAMETHILSLDLEVQAGNFQLSAAVFSDSLPRSFQAQEKPIVTLTSDFEPTLQSWEGTRGSHRVICGCGFLIEAA